MSAIFNDSHTARLSLTLDGLNDGVDDTLIFVGLNPSKADGLKQSDATARAVATIAKNKGFSRVILINPCAKVETDSSKLSYYNGRPFRKGDTDNEYVQIHTQNMEHIRGLLDNYPEATVWCGWGDSIDEEKNYHIKFYLAELLKLLIAHNLHCVQIKTRFGLNPQNPRHPRRIPFDAEKPKADEFKVADVRFVDFNVEKYFQKIKSDLTIPLVRVDGPMSYDYHSA